MIKRSDFRSDVNGWTSSANGLFAGGDAVLTVAAFSPSLDVLESTTDVDGAEVATPAARAGNASLRGLLLALVLLLIAHRVPLR